MRRSLGDGWSIELSGSWTWETTDDSVTRWHASGRAMRANPGPSWRCADGADIIAALDAELPPDPTPKVGEGGRDGIGHRAAWLYRHGDSTEFTLYGFTFVDGAYLETVFTSTNTADLEWAFDAWRSVARSDDGRSDDSSIGGARLLFVWPLTSAGRPPGWRTPRSVDVPVSRSA